MKSATTLARNPAPSDTGAPETQVIIIIANREDSARLHVVAESF